MMTETVPETMASLQLVTLTSLVLGPRIFFFGSSTQSATPSGKKPLGGVPTTGLEMFRLPTMEAISLPALPLLLELVALMYGS